MIGMRVSDNGAIHRAPRIDVEIAASAIESVVSQLEQGVQNLSIRNALHYH